MSICFYGGYLSDVWLLPMLWRAHARQKDPDYLSKTCEFWLVLKIVKSEVFFCQTTAEEIFEKNTQSSYIMGGIADILLRNFCVIFVRINIWFFLTSWGGCNVRFPLARTVRIVSPKLTEAERRFSDLLISMAVWFNAEARILRASEPNITAKLNHLWDALESLNHGF